LARKPAVDGWGRGVASRNAAAAAAAVNSVGSPVGLLLIDRWGGSEGWSVVHCVSTVGCTHLAVRAGASCRGSNDAGGGGVCGVSPVVHRFGEALVRRDRKRIESRQNLHIARPLPIDNLCLVNENAS